MRSYHTKNNFFYKMKKKPAVQSVIDNIDNYTVQELLDLKGNQFPKWIREELIHYKNRNGKTSEDIAAELAQQMPKHTIENQTHFSYQYKGEDMFVGKETNAFRLEINNNDLFMVLTETDNDCTIKLNFDVCTITLTEYKTLLLQSEFIERTSVAQYNRLVSVNIKNKQGKLM